MADPPTVVGDVGRLRDVLLPRQRVGLLRLHVLPASRRAPHSPIPHADGSPRAERKDKCELVEQGRAHGIVVYDGDTPIGWCQYGRRDELPRIDARRTYRETPPADETETLWRITCFFVARSHRGKGIAKFALHAALESIRRQGGGTVEAYPVVSEKMAAVAEWRWFGTVGMFRREGFRTIAPLGTSGVLVRKRIAP